MEPVEDFFGGEAADVSDDVVGGVGLVVVAVIASWYTDRQQRSLRRGERIVFSLGVGLATCLPFIGHEHFWFLVSLGALGTVISAVWGEWISRPADRNA